MRKVNAWVVVFVICGFVSGCGVTTKPLMREDILNRIDTDRTAMYKGQEPLIAPISLEEAMARSIKYNLDHRLKIMEDALALRQVDIMTFDMLPRLVASAGYTERDSYNAASSMDVLTERQSLVPSTSQDKGHFNGDLTLTWNILDFGVSYFQAKQQSDRAHIMKERRRKVVHNIMQQIRQAYWLALGAQQLEGRFEPLLLQVNKALQDVNSIDNEKLRPPLETLTYRKTLLEIMKQLESFRDELAQARPRLASLMNIPPGQSFRLLLPSAFDIPKFPETLEAMENHALIMRPELIEADYNERISAYETRKAIARMFPGFELTVGGHYDSNSFLVNNSWYEGSARITWNLLNLLSGPSQYKIAKSQAEIVQTQRLALSMAVLTQVHLAYRDFFNRKRQYELAELLQDVDARIHQQTMNQAASGAQSRLIEIRAATAALMAEYRRYQNYAALQSAYGQMIASIGIDPLPATVTGHDVKTLSQAIRSFQWHPVTSTSPGPAPVPVEKKQ
jgi:outer membrane protein TolC